MASQYASKSYQKASVVKGHHVYKVIWTPEVGEELLVNHEYGNKHDERAIAVMKDSEIFGHLPHTVLHISSFFLRHVGRIVCRVTGKWRHIDGLEVPCVYVYFGNAITNKKLSNC